MQYVLAGGSAALILVALFVLLRGGKTAHAPAPAAAQPGGSKPKVPRPAAAVAEKPASNGSFDDDDDDSEMTMMAANPLLGTNLLQEGLDLDIDVDAANAFDEEEPTGPIARILVSAFGNTDTGRKRKHNEDAYCTIKNEVFAVADGMGGYAAGEVASALAIDVLTAAFETGHFGGDENPKLPRRGDELVRAIVAANNAIFAAAEANEAQRGMGTTFVAARFSPNKQRVYIAHVGDSRCYRIRNGKIIQLTEDHTLAAAGITGPHGAKLTRALGIAASVEVDLRIDEPEGGDHYLVCSDGLSKMVPDDDVTKIVLEAGDLDSAVTNLIAEANERGGRDNISVILVRVDDIDAQAAVDA